MGRVSQWAVGRPWFALLAWIGIFVVVGVLGTTFGGAYSNNFQLPNTESTTAQDLLSKLSGGAGTGTGLDGQVVWKSASGKATEGSAAATMKSVLTTLSTSPRVACVLTPLGAPVASACPKRPAGQGGQGQQGQGAQQGQPQPSPAARGALAHFGQAGVSPDGSVAYATVSYKGATFNDLNTGDLTSQLNLIKAQNGKDGLQVGANGVFAFVGGEPPSSESIGVTVALVILLFAFGSILGAFLPIVSAALSVALTTTFALPLVARFFDVATFAPILASMIGLGVGIDYSLFVINRYREAIIHGQSPRDAALESVRTSGRAVQFAAATVIIALLGLFVMRISFFNGISVAAAITVFMVMVVALLLLPAVLSLLGTWAFLGRMAWITDREAIPKQRLTGARHTIGRLLRYLGWILCLPVTLIGLAWRRIVHHGHAPDPNRPNAFARYGHWLQRRPWLTAAFALLVMLVVAIPVLSLRLGFAGDSGTPQGTPPRIAYDLAAEGFGPGVNGPFFIAVKLPRAGDQAAVTTLTDALNKEPGVALGAVAPVAANATVAPIQVVPKSAPQDKATTDLLVHLRQDVIPAATAGSQATAYVGGFQAVTADFTQVLQDALPWFLLIVVGLGFLALVVLFRSLLVPATGALSSLLSLGAALGVTVAVFQWGWFSEVVKLE